MSYSTASIANSARRVRERRRLELELQQQKQQQQVPLLAPRSPGSSSSAPATSTSATTRQSSRSPKTLPLNDMDPIRTSHERSRSPSPHNMTMIGMPSMNSSNNSSKQGLYGSPPVSPRVASNDLPNVTGSTICTGTSNSNNSHNQHRPIFSNRRPPIVSPSSPQHQQTSRSWDEGDSNYNNSSSNNRPPSPSIRSASSSPLPSWTLQPKLQHQQASPTLPSSPLQPAGQLHPRTSNNSGTGIGGPRIVAELATFPAIPAKPAGRYSFRRVRSTPAVGIRSSTDPTTSVYLSEIPTEESLSRSEPIHPSSSGEEESSFNNETKNNVSPAISSVSSFEGTPVNSSIQSLCKLMVGNGPRPTHLSLEEKALWDAMQTIRYHALQEGMQQAKNELVSTSRNSTIQNNTILPVRNGSPHSVDTSWDLGFVELQEQAVIQQRDNSRSLQAIQRVLSDVQAERDQAVVTAASRLQQDNNNSSSNSPDTNVTTITRLANQADPGLEKEVIQRDLDAMSAHIISLERELLNIHPIEPEVKVTVEPFGSNGTDDFNAIIEQLENEKDALIEKLEWKDLVIEQLEKQAESVKIKRERLDSIDSTASVMSSPQTKSLENDELRKELQEKTSALENAKMIIASLENASGSLAADLRRKLRERDDDFINLQKELSEKQRALDTLATELRDLQNLHASSVPLQDTEAAQVRRLKLSSRLETNLAEIRAAAVILESTQDASAVSSLSELLSDSARALRDGIDVIENGVAEERHGALRYHRELEEKNKTIKRLEDLLRAQSTEASRYKTTNEDLLRRREDEINALHAEIKILRQQCNTNMEVLTRKERELAVLRDSLRVEDDGVGYISDDEPDDDDQPADPSPTSNRSFDSALNRDTNAAIQAAVAQSSSSNEEIELLKNELNKARAEYEQAQRQLMVDKESLSNAKMIISSLERASKTMMEDSRARLQDSNTAIASLLEKYMESEKTSARLRSENEALKMANNRHEQICDPSMDEVHHEILAAPIQPLLLTETID